ncbi:MAG: hypothetical protein JNM18_23345, partial [Planctomycetaceae bacterium]|nr:hypothetical protein [Planctomycetaceae bacterium]
MKPASIEGEIKRIASRFRRRTLWRRLTLVWVMAIVVAWLAFFASPSLNSLWPSRPVFIGSLGIATLVALYTWFRRLDLRAVAHQIETVYPDLDTKLLAAYEQEQSTPPGRRGFLEEQVIQQARVHALNHERWKQTVPGEQLFAWSSAQLAALML